METHKLQERLLKAMLYKERQNRNGVRDTAVSGAATLIGIGFDIAVYREGNFTDLTAGGLTVATLAGSYSTFRGINRWRNARHDRNDRLRYQEEIGVTSEHVEQLCRGELSFHPEHPKAPVLGR